MRLASAAERTTATLVNSAGIDLTGLMNRRCIHEAILAVQANVERNATPACVAIVDIDHFKRINNWGHAGGDLVLKAFAQALQKGLRTND